MGDVATRGYTCVRAQGKWKTSILSSPFCCKANTAQKKKKLRKKYDSCPAYAVDLQRHSAFRDSDLAKHERGDVGKWVHKKPHSPFICRADKANQLWHAFLLRPRMMSEPYSIHQSYPKKETHLVKSVRQRQTYTV